MAKFICVVSKGNPGFNNGHRSFFIEADNLEFARKSILANGLADESGFSVGLWEPLLVAESRVSYKWKRKEGNELLPVKL